ncbi:MAG: hypothetical protein ACKOAX_01100 [Candidatus Kapaibacterium sp.]
MKPLRIALLWHHHQPYYTVDDRFLLPWVRLHAAKDYVDLALIQLSHPEIRCTYNIVPSLLLQIDEYLAGTEDEVLTLTKVPAANLSPEQKQRLLHLFFLCHHETMLLPYDRYRELFERSRDEATAIREFEERDWRDLQVWYNLTWIGPVTRENEHIRRLITKGSDFSEGDKRTVLSQHMLALHAFVPLLKQLYATGKADLSMTPLYHPILPLIMDSDAALEAAPQTRMPRHRYRQEQDAEWQVRRGEQIFAEAFGCSPRGVWCSEGSVSMEVLRLLGSCGFAWTATDEHVLRNSRPGRAHTHAFFPHTVREDRRPPITLFFRDHGLSDAIGFEYKHWEPDHAAQDFIRRLHEIRTAVIREHGEDALEEAVVPIILDGENCWEFYRDNGRPFLHSLYSRIAEDEHLVTVTFSETCQSAGDSADHVLERVVAGSWIHGDFAIWIGHEEKNAAWDALYAARTLAGTKRVTKKQWREAMEHVYIAEGSDWFWWYGDDHSAPSREVFDEIFRYHLRRVYELYDEEVPAVLQRPMMISRHGVTAYSTMHGSA